MGLLLYFIVYNRGALTSEVTKKGDKTMTESTLDVSQVDGMKKLIFGEKPVLETLELPRSTENYLPVQSCPIEFMPFGQVLVEVDFTERLAALGAEKGNRVFIRIFKLESILEVWLEVDGEYRLFKYYPVCNYSGFLGPKLKEGDRQAPEGFYAVERSALNPNSKFHLSFNLGYPNAYDRAYGRTGSYLMIHGKCDSIGCYAMEDRPIEEIYGLVEAALKTGQQSVPVHIFPFRMTDVRMANYTLHPWYEFWTNLKEGYEYFEAEKVPPRVEVEGKHYTIYEANQ
jgi:murein L,D-transpeptidase YafK